MHLRPIVWASRLAAPALSFVLRAPVPATVAGMALNFASVAKPELDKSKTAHFANFIAALRSRCRAEGAASCVLVHLANIAHRFQPPVRFDGSTLTCIGDDEAYRIPTRPYRSPGVVPDKVWLRRE